MHKSLDEFDVRSDPTTDSGVSCPLKASEKGMYNSNAFIFDWIFFVLAGKRNMHKSMSEFEYRPHPTTD